MKTENPGDTPALAKAVMTALLAKGWLLATAESCTGGLIAAAMTSLPGSSAVLDCGFVTYSNESKTIMLGVSREILAENGAVSPETAASMVHGALVHSRAQLALSVTGIAGPSGGSAEKPVGLVYIGIGLRGEQARVSKHMFRGNRDAVRAQSVAAALALLLGLLQDQP